MSNLEKSIEAAHERTHREIPNPDVAISQIKRRAQKRKNIRVGSLAFLVVTAVVLIAIWSTEEEKVGEIVFPDGSVASYDQTPELTLQRAESDAIEISLVRGDVTFSVTKDERRKFTVLVNETRVDVIGTTFRVNANREFTEVELLEGSVLVTHKQSKITLAEGLKTRIRFLRSEPEVTTREVGDPMIELAEQKSDDAVEKKIDAIQKEEKTTEVRAEKRPTIGSNELRKMMKDPKQAAKELDRLTVRDDVETLFLASDAMRSAGRHRDATKYLKRIVSRHKRDKRTNLARFTLGTLFLDQLGDSRTSAKHFSKVNPSHPLFEEALARQVDAHSESNDAEKATAAAKKYLQKFPQGVYRERVSKKVEPR